MWHKAYVVFTIIFSFMKKIAEKVECYFRYSVVFASFICYVAYWIAFYVKVRGPFVETFCIEKDSYIDAI